MRRINKAGKKVALIGVENGYPLGDASTAVKRVKEFYDRGARYLSLAHNGHSQLADSNNGEASGQWAHNGLSDLGKQVIAELNRVGIMVDLSHPSKAANLQAIALSKAPVIASHSSARALCDHSRNMDDELLLALKKNGGVVQTVAFAAYVKTPPPPTAERLAALTKLEEEFGLPAGSLGRGGRGGGGAWRGRRLVTPRGAGGRGAAAPAAAGGPRTRARRRARAATRRQARRGRRSGSPRSTSSSRRRRARTSRTSSITSTTSSRRSASITSASRRTSTAAAASTAGTTPTETFNVTLELVRRGYTEEQIGKIWSGNLLRVMEEVRQVAVEAAEVAGTDRGSGISGARDSGIRKSIQISSRATRI